MVVNKSEIKRVVARLGIGHQRDISVFAHVKTINRTIGIGADKNILGVVWNDNIGCHFVGIGQWSVILGLGRRVAVAECVADLMS